MKKFLVLLAFWTAAIAVEAQLVQFGLTGDLAFDRVASRHLDGGSPVQPDKGWSAGVKVKVSFPLGLGFDLGLKYAMEERGYSWMDMQNNGNTDMQNMLAAGDVSVEAASIDGRVSFVSMPLNLRYDFKFPVVRRVVIPYAFTGPEFCYTFKGFDWKGSDVGDRMKDYVEEQDLNWNYNFGFGVILGQHVEIAYTYSMRMTEPLDLSDKHLGAEIESRYKARKNKIGLTIYF